MANTRQTYLLFVVAFLILRFACYSLFGNCEHLPHNQKYADRLRESSLDAVYRSDAEVVDYPQLALLMMRSAGWLADQLPEGSEQWVYHKRFHGRPVRDLRFETAYAIVIFLCDAAIFVSLCVAVPRVVGASALSDRLAQYLVIGTIFASILYSIFDLFVGASALAAWLAFRRNYYLLAYLFLTIGAAYKVVPVLLFPVVILAGAVSDAANSARVQSFSRSLVKHVMQATAIVSLWPILAYSFGGGRDSFEYLHYHSVRGFEIGSNYAWLILLAEPDTRIVHEFESYTLRGDLADSLARISTPIAIGALVGMFGVYSVAVRRWFSRVHKSPDESNESLAQLVLVGMIAVWVVYVAFGKVGSPQYAIWFMPLIPFVRANRNLLMAYASFSIACTIAYPWCFADIIGVRLEETPLRVSGPTRFGFAVLIARTLSLIWLMILLVSRLLSTSESSGNSSALSK
jgi:hypothetical protein